MGWIFLRIMPMKDRFFLIIKFLICIAHISNVIKNFDFWPSAPKLAIVLSNDLFNFEPFFIFQITLNFYKIKFLDIVYLSYQRPITTWGCILLPTLLAWVNGGQGSHTQPDAVTEAVVAAALAASNPVQEADKNTVLNVSKVRVQMEGQLSWMAERLHNWKEQKHIFSRLSP